MHETPQGLVPSGRQPGSAAFVLRARGVRVREPLGDTIVHALASWQCTVWGWRRGAPLGDASCLREGRLELGADPPPAARALGRRSRSVAHRLRVPVCGRGDPALAPQLAFPFGHCVPWGWREVARGGSSRCVEGRLG